jgi:hypothetical protein
MKLTQLIIILFITIFVSIFLSFYLVNKTLLFSYKEIPIDFKVEEHLGFNPDKDALHFGTLIPGYSGFRNFDIQNLECKKCRVVLKTDSNWINIDKNNFVLSQNEKETIYVYLNVPADAKIGQYNNTLKIYLWKTI